MSAIYLAAPLAQAHVARLLATMLASAGHRITSTWHATAATVDPTHIHDRRACLADNLQDLTRADLVVAWTAEGTPRATLCEIGHALATGKPVVWVQGAGGEGANIFDASPLVTVVREHREEVLLGAVRGAMTGVEVERG